MDIKLLLLKGFFSFPLGVLKKIDVLRERKQGIVDLEDRYGMEAFVGLAGEGKTISMVHLAKEYREKYGNDIYIFSNFCCSYSDATFYDYRQFLGNFNKSVLILYDEMPNDFGKNDHFRFPADLFSKLTQLRKGNGLKIVYSTQDIMLIDPDIRRLTKIVNECRTYKRRLTYYFSYDMDFYKARHEAVSIDNKDKAICNGFKYFLQSKKLRESYQSFALVDNTRKFSNEVASVSQNFRRA